MQNTEQSWTDFGNLSFYPEVNFGLQLADTKSKPQKQKEYKTNQFWAEKSKWCTFISCN